MKKLLHKMFVAAVLLGAAACSSDFLTEHPVDEMYADNLLVNYSGFYSMISAQRGLMRNEHCVYSGTAITPNSAFNGGSDLYFGNQRISTARWFNWPNMIVQDTDGEVFSETFSNMYTIINASNMIVNRAENDEDVDWESSTPEGREAHRQSIVAQARFFRAWAYRHLTYAFGDVPLSLEEINGSNYRTDWTRDPVSAVRAAMIEDFRYCVEHLDWRTDGNNTKPNRAIASHYLAETYMAMGMYSEAVAVLKTLCEESPYRLMTERFGSNAANPGNCFIDIFRSPLYTEGNYETLYSFVNGEYETHPYGSTSNSRIRNMFKNYYSLLSGISGLTHPDYEGKTTELFWSLNGGKGCARLTVPIGAWRLYEWDGQQDNDIRYDEYSVYKTLYFLDKDNNVYEVLDKNGNSLISLTPNSAMFAGSEGTIKNYMLPSVKKWDYVHSNFELSADDPDYLNISYLRLADSYLLYAEALMKSGDKASAAQWINKIRARAGVSPVTAEQVDMDFILDERARELLCEGQRRHTLIRVSQENGGDERDVDNYFKRRVRRFNEVCGQVDGVNEWGYNTVSHGMDVYETPVLFAIPKVFIDANTTVQIPQNPGYPSY